MPSNFIYGVMKVIVDNKIPYLQGIIEQLADEVIYLPGKAFTPEIVKDADALPDSTTLTLHIVKKPVSLGATVPDAMPEL